MDIVERLRQRIGLVKFDSDAIALRDAADIIEQLRGQVEFASECRNGAYADAEIQNAKIERLRDAFSEAIEFADQDYHALTPTGETMISRWRSALQQKDTEKLSQMMIRCGLATGHGDTIDDLIFELEKQIKDTSHAFSDARKQIERLREALREICEVYAGSEGIPQPMTAAEGYLLSLLMEVVRIAQEALKEKE